MLADITVGDALELMDRETESFPGPAKDHKVFYRMLRERLPGTTIVSIGHRSTLEAFHDRRMVLEPEGGGFTPREVRKAVPAE